MVNDLHAAGFTPNYISEHEKMYTDKGVPIKFVIMKKKPGSVDLDPVRYVMPGAFAKLRMEAEALEAQNDDE